MGSLGEGCNLLRLYLHEIETGIFGAFVRYVNIVFESFDRLCMSPTTALILILGYFLLLVAISFLTSKTADNQSFFTANRQAPWYLVAFGMIGATLSGVTFISVPGAVGAGGANQAFAYMQLVLGYVVGYIVIAKVLLPVYYRLKLTSIYAYLDQRFGNTSYKTGAGYFLVSRIIGASFRLYLVAIVMDKFILGPLNIPFAVTVAAAIVLIWIYTFRGGIKTVVWTETFQTAAMLLAVFLTVGAIAGQMDLGIGGIIDRIGDSPYGKVFFFENGWSDPNNFFKQFLAGMFLTIVMTGLDQDMMQKNLTVKTLKDAQLNMYTFTGILVMANILFLTLGAMLYLHAGDQGIAIPESADQLFPTIALEHLPPVIGIVFLLGLIAAAYSSADSALTALTTSFCVDFLGFEKKPSTPQLKQTRWLVHAGFSVVLFIVIIIFREINDRSVINQLFTVAGYTYGPLLGFYALGLFTRVQIRDQWSPLICILSPILTYIISTQSEAWIGYKFGFELLILNGLLTFVGLLLIQKDPDDSPSIDDIGSSS
ncbi:MAG: sodium:solute symporter [Bacteroidota bacterium]